jgi:hypothetical protein
VDTKPLHFETAKSETPKQRETIKTVHHFGRVSESGKRVGNRGIGVFGHTKIMTHGITICDFPMRLGPFVLRTRGNDRSHREIVNPVDEVSMLNEVANPESRRN